MDNLKYTGVGTKTYEQCTFKFVTDYSRENPATRVEALTEFLWKLNPDKESDSQVNYGQIQSVQQVNIMIA
jgi:hypothetical protein